jgi:hypothetical protein
MKKLPDCRNSPLKAPRPLCLEQRECPEAGTHPHRRTGDVDLVADRGKDPTTERATVDGRRGVPLVAIAGREERDPKRSERAALDHRAGVVGEACERVVFGSVVGYEQRQPSLFGRPDGELDLLPEHPHPDLVDGPRACPLVQPGRRAVAESQRDGLLPERARGPRGVARVADNSGGAVAV